MRIYLKNNPAKFHPDPIWNDGALGFLMKSPQQEEEQDEQRYEISSW